jgi:benzoyl-CoA reductase/2-hydroxyglutaryl-CoA dehydratase subunit BcrC/BadD/HgdB
VDALTRMEAVYDDRLGEVQRRRDAGSRLIGYCLNSIPIEIILAAGLDPVRIVGDPQRPIDIAERYLEEYFDGEVRALFAAAVEGDFAACELLILPRSSEVYLQLYYLLQEIPKWEPSARAPPLYLFDLLQTPHWTTAHYDLGRMKGFAARLEEIGGSKVSDEALQQAIAITNRLRTLVNEVSGMWQDVPSSLSGVQALKVIGAASIMHPADAIETLEALLRDRPEPSDIRSGPRVMIKGSPQSDPRFTRLVEDCGAQVVAHDHVAGDRIFSHLISTSENPWEALVDQYQRNTPGPRAYPQMREDAAFIALAERASVEGVIFYHDEWDDTLGWEYPDQKALLDRKCIPHLFLKRQPYFHPDERQQRMVVEQYLQTLGEAQG